MVATSSQRPLLSPWAFDHSHVSNSTTAILAEMMKVMVVMVIETMVMEEVPLNNGHAGNCLRRCISLALEALLGNPQWGMGTNS